RHSGEGAHAAHAAAGTQPDAIIRRLEMRLANKTALITGGYSGIALATARLFLAEGAQVVIIGRNKTTLNAAAETLGGHVLALQADVTEVEAVEHAVAATAERFGKLDIVFANAGIAEGWSAYAAAKGGVRSMTRNLASVSRVGRRSERDCHGDRG